MKQLRVCGLASRSQGVTDKESCHGCGAQRINSSSRHWIAHCGGRDAEKVLRSKWLEVLSDLFAFHENSNGNSSGSEGGQSEAARCRPLRHHSESTRTLSHKVSPSQSFPSETRHLTEFLEVRHSDPGNRGSLKGTREDHSQGLVTRFCTGNSFQKRSTSSSAARSADPNGHPAGTGRFDPRRNFIFFFRI